MPCEYMKPRLAELLDALRTISQFVKASHHCRLRPLYANFAQALSECEDWDGWEDVSKIPEYMFHFSLGYLNNDLSMHGVISQAVANSEALPAEFQIKRKTWTSGQYRALFFLLQARHIFSMWTHGAFETDALKLFLGSFKEGAPLADSLCHLELSGESLDFASVEMLRQIKSLRHFSVILPTLKRVSGHFDLFSGAGQQGVAAIPRLETFSMHIDAQNVAAALRLIRETPALKKLHICASGADLSNMDVSLLSDGPMLQELYFHVSDKSLDATSFQKAFPALRSTPGVVHVYRKRADTFTVATISDDI